MARKKKAALPELDEDLEVFLEKVIRLVSFTDAKARAPELKIGPFSAARKVAVYLELTDWTRPQIAELVSLSTDAVRKVTQSEAYPVLEELVRESVETLIEMRTMMEASEKFEGVMVGELMNQALLGTGRDKQKAIDEFLARMSSKKGRETEGAQIHVPKQMLEFMQKALDTMERAERKQLPAGGEGDVIEAEVISATVIPRPDYGDDEQPAGS